jgi:hypothetical protein
LRLSARFGPTLYLDIQLVRVAASTSSTDCAMRHFTADRVHDRILEYAVRAFDVQALDYLLNRSIATDSRGIERVRAALAEPDRW